MKTHTSRLLAKFRSNLTTYARSYFLIHGDSPTAPDLCNIVRSALDQISNPSIRAKLRKAVVVRRLDVNKDRCIVEYGVEKRYIDYFDKTLGD